MKNLKSIILLAFIAFCFACDDDDAAPDLTTGTISGKVTDSENGSPIEGANIKTLPASRSVNSDSEGNYSISNIKAGEYQIIGSKTNYVTDTVETVVTAGAIAPGDITLSPLEINNPPEEPENNFPNTGAVDQPTTLILDWSSTDEDGDTLTYEVLFDTVNPPVESFVSDYDSTSILIDNLENGTTYYWQVIITDSKGGVTTGEVWEFTTSTASDPVGVTEMDFENGIGDWSVDNGLWEVGTATVGPESAHSGQLVAGTVLGGDYPHYANTRLISPSLLLPEVQAGEKVQLKFWHWYLMENGDKGLIQISVDGGEWETVSDPPFDGSSSVWTQHVTDLTAYSGSNVRVAFYFTSDQSFASNGWYIDDVSVEKKIVIFPNPEDFESGIGDWSADNGIWEVGAATVGPETVHSGQQLAGTVLGGGYPHYANTRLISPSILLPEVQAGEKVQLKFWHWYLMENGDKGLIQISVDGGEWETVSDPPFDGSSSVWTQHVIDLTAYSGSNVRMAFYFTSDQSFASNGWYVDDVSVEKN